MCDREDDLFVDRVRKWLNLSMIDGIYGIREEVLNWDNEEDTEWKSISVGQGEAHYGDS